MADKLNASSSIPISQLCPQLSEQSTRSIKAIVTLIWPYSSSNQSLTILLAEPDFRLRRAKGQVRVSFHGSSARAVYEAGIGSGDEVTLSLEGVEWTQDDSTAQTPGRGIEWDLQYAERVLLEIRVIESQRVSLVDVDHPPTIQTNSTPQIPTPEAIASVSESTAPVSGKPELLRTETNEWSSPAFIKRARLSYGSLFESNYDIFAGDDRSVPGKGRKRTKFGRESGAWRYSSRSVSPEGNKKEDDDMIDSEPESPVEPKPLMLDEGSQTVEFEDDAVAALTDLSRQAVAAGGEPRVLKEHMPEESAHDIERSGGPRAMRPPPRPQLIVDPGSQDDINDQQAVVSTTSPPSSPRLRPIPSDGLSLVSPLVSPRLGGPHDRWERVDGNMSWNPQPQIPAFTEEGLSSESQQPFARTDYFDTIDQYEPWQTAVAANDSISASMSPAKSVEVIANQGYLEHDIGAAEMGVLDVGPYYANEHVPYHHDYDSQSYPGLQEEHIDEHSLRPLETGVEGDNNREVEEDDSALLPESGEGTSFHADIAMSRSPSSELDVIDLIEGSDEEEQDEEDNELRNIETNNTSSAQQLPDEFSEDLSVEEDEDDEAIYDEESASGDEPFDDEELSENDEGLVNVRYPPGFSPRNETGSKAAHRSIVSEEGDYVDDNEEEEEEEEKEEYEEDYDDEELDTDQDNNGLRAIAKVPEVIDLLSSDEDERDDHDSIIEDRLEGEDPGNAQDYLSEDMSDAPNTTTPEESVRERLIQTREPESSVVDHMPAADEYGRVASETNADTNIDEENLPEDIQQPPSSDNGHQVLDADIKGIDGRGKFAPEGLEDITEETNSREIIHEPSEKGNLSDEDDSAQIVEQPSVETMVVYTEDSLEHTEQYDLRSDPVEEKLEVEAQISVQENDSPSPDEQWHDASDIPAEDILISEDTSNEHQHHLLKAPAEGVEETVQPDIFYPSLDEQVDALASNPVNISNTVEAFDNGSSDAAVPEVTFATPETPKRHMRTRSTVSQHSTRTDRSSSLVIEELATSEGYDASAELALDSLESPSQIRASQSVSSTTLRMQLGKSLRTNLSQFTALKLLRLNLDRRVDVLAIATTTTHPENAQRAKSGPRHYQLRFNITDPSLTSTIAEVQIFRPYKEALPTVSAGDGILLRNFLVKAEQKRGFPLRSETESSWVIFKADGTEEARGPPAELGAEERSHIASLKQWFWSLDASAKAKLDKANGDKKDSPTKAVGKLF